MDLTSLVNNYHFLLKKPQTKFKKNEEMNEDDNNNINDYYLINWVLFNKRLCYDCDCKV